MTVAPSPAPFTRAMSWRARLLWMIVALLSVGIAAWSTRWFLNPPQSPEQALGNPLGVPWLIVHIAGSVTALALGSLQFVARWRRRGRPHRWIGRVYVLGCLVGGGAGLILAFGSSAGPIVGVGFGALAALWIAVNLLGWRAAVQGRFDAHRRWMIRSWALTLAAVTLRIYLPTAIALELPVLEAYRAIAWLCWVPNLLLAEVWLAARPTLIRPKASQ